MEILVTGGNGQLGKSIRNNIKNKKHNFIFVDKNELDITNTREVEKYFENHKIDIVINCAAFTNVDNSKNNISSHLVNTFGPLNLALCASNYDATMIHISTDYVFDGEKNTPYTELDNAIPLNDYGKTKLDGENCILKFDDVFVFRTSWLYSIYENNFLRTMFNRISSKKETFVVNDQVGTPTSAKSLANFLLWFIDNYKEKNIKNGLYHFSNEGVASWYDFAKTIELLYKEKTCKEYKNLIKPCSTDEYLKMIGKEIEKRPNYSVLSKDKIKKIYGENINHWVIELSNEIKDLINNENK
jgi:dTDP-4-dehydrorhamnose reductase